MNMPEKNLFSLPFKMEFDWYIVVADKENLQCVQQIMLSIPGMCRMVIIATGKFKKANKLLAEQKSIYLIEVADEGQNKIQVFEKALRSIFIPEGRGCIYINASPTMMEVTKNLFNRHSIIQH